MEYTISLGNMIFPISPKNITTKIKSRNNTINLVDGYEYNLINKGGLLEISFQVLLPSVKYPFATYIDGFIEPKVYIDYIAMLKNNCEVVSLKIGRNFKDKEYNQEISVVVESYTIIEDVNNGFDFMLNMELKEYRKFESSILLENPLMQNSATPENKVTIEEYSVVNGDNLWNIAKRYYGDGNKYSIIYEANKDKVTNPNLIFVGQVLKIPKIN